MQIRISVSDDVGEEIFYSESFSIESAIGELGRFERQVDRTKPKETSPWNS